jgi:hypothetical protein
MTTPFNPHTYKAPVDRLLSYGDCNQLNWRKLPDYVAELGLTQADVPELMRMMTDEALWTSDADTLAPWGVVHAWRSLAQLKASEAIAPFIALIDQYQDDDWLMMDSSRILALYGVEALPIFTSHLADAKHLEFTRAAIAEGIEMIAKAEPDQRDRCIEIITQQLGEFAQNGKWLNGSLIGSLVELEVVDAAPLMEQAFAAKVVDDDIPGTWAQVQVDLGLKQESDFSPDDFVSQFHKNQEAARLLRNPSAEEDDWPMAPFESNWSFPDLDEPPPKFGQGFLSVPKANLPSSSLGFGASSNKSKKKKGKK